MFETLSVDDLQADDRGLVLAALGVSQNAYAPYSGFAVGAALSVASGAIYRGVNVENASYGVGICAEISAITAAVTAGDIEVKTIAVTGQQFISSANTDEIVTPCGRCRQIILEIAQASGHDIRVLCASANLRKIWKVSISELLPVAFGPANLGLTDASTAARRDLALSIARTLKDLTGGPIRKAMVPSRRTIAGE